MTIVIAFERYSAVTNPIAHRNSSRFSSLKTRVLKYMSIVVFFSILYGFPLFFAFQIQEIEIEEGIIKNCVVPWIRTNKHFILIYNNIINLIVTGIIPIVLLVFFYCKIYVAISDGTKSRAELVNRKMSTTSTNCILETQESKAEEKKNERIQSIILIGIVISFLICHVPRIVLNIDEMLSESDRNRVKENAERLGISFMRKCTGVRFWIMIFKHWHFFLLCVNPIINFFIYSYFSKKFQEVLKSKIITLMYICDSNNDTEPSSCCGSFWCASTCTTMDPDTQELTEYKRKITATEKTPLNPVLK